ncbi:EAL domain-containing protein [Massilia sp. R2A-15]|uniref:bifunctional diguanylate cyclase/phosphodiesterase n=1 Tax=Massilia sp. R2A-15 TaxID=3064278 RepID=UPI0027336843|nr:EAL domain-containing protein [Massilia sp. R2A-15]WLI91370.1 EAL domain-containing protein [Massilia sp. R2A-15]
MTPPSPEDARTLHSERAAPYFAGWEVDLPARTTWWSPQALALLELPAGAAPGVDAAIAMTVAESRAAMRDLFERCARDGDPWDTTVEMTTAGGRRIRVESSGRALRLPDGQIVRIQVAWREAAPHAHGEDDPARLVARLAKALDTMSEAFLTMDTALRFTYLNPEAEALLRRSRGELLGKLAWEAFPGAIGGPSYREYSRALRERRVTTFEEYYAPLRTWFEVRCYPIEDGLAVYFHDINERKEARLALKQAHRALQMLSRCNHVVAHAAREPDLIAEVCRIAVDVGGYRMAWVGYAEHDAAKSISIAAHAGHPDDVACLRRLPLGWSGQDESGRGPAGVAIRSGDPVIVEDMAQDFRFAPSLAAEAVCGHGGAVYLPLKNGGRPFGLLVLYTGDVAESDTDEARLLQELADNLAFGITAVRMRQEQQKLQAAFTKMAASVSTTGGEHFFEQLAGTMAEAVGADGGVIARLLPGEPLMARSVIAVIDGVRVPDFKYVVADAPCQMALEREHIFIPDAANELFPGSPPDAVGARAYGGWRLRDSSGRLLGIAFVLFRRPINRSEFVTSTLRIFAARAAAELERQDADASLRTQASLLDKAQDAIIVRDLDDHIQYWNKSAERMYGWTSEEVMGRKVDMMLLDEPEKFRAVKDILLQTGHWNGETTRMCKDGSALTVQVALSLIAGDDGKPEGILAINTDITARKAAEREIERLAFYDPVTSLPNRLLLLDRLQHALTVAARTGAMGALLFIDLDHFKTINDTLGHEKGDQLLQQVGQRLRECVFEIDTVARFGGDEFVILLENLSKQPAEAATIARQVCERIARACAEPVTFDGFARHTTASIGVTLFDNRASAPSELLKQADLAMYEVKAAGRNGVRFFDPAMQTVVSARAALEADLREGLHNGEFLLHYQPQLDRAGAVTGAEALIRWNNARRGMVSPVAFIPIAEETGLILPLGRWVLEQACAQLARWAADPQLRRLTISVNVSARQLRQPRFVEEVFDVLERAGAAPKGLKIEITESLLVDDTETTIETMHRLKARGVCFSLDDFGTGYSSLSYLKRLPLDQLKIDRSFISDVMSDTSDAAITRTIFALGRCLDLDVIAEGVESEAQHRFLMEQGCDAFQGYLFSRPVPVDEFEAFVRKAPGAAS